MRQILLILFLFVAALPVFAQTPSLQGLVTDESGALVPGAKVVITRADGSAPVTVTADSGGAYAFAKLPSGSYVVSAIAPDLATPQPLKIVSRGAPQVLNLELKVSATQQQMTVKENLSSTVSTDASNNASALVLQGDDLLALSDNPDDLAADLQALAGPSAGPGGGSIFIDGCGWWEVPPDGSVSAIPIRQ